jgi:hypothetical protein
MKPAPYSRPAPHSRARALPRYLCLRFAPEERRFATAALCALASLFGFKDEAAAFVEINAPCARAVVAVIKRHRALEDISVLRVVCLRRLRALNLQHIAQLAQE